MDVFANGKALLDAFIAKPCDMIITDIVMPKLSGYDLCREIRKTSMIPIFMISANNEEIDRVLGLELGSDDYISKPISFRELLIKIKNAFRRLDSLKTPSDSAAITCQDLKLNKQSREIFINDQLLQTTSKEFDLLYLFLQSKNVAFSRDQIIDQVWGYDYYGDLRQVDHIIKRLRKKMIQADAQCRIQTVWGYGYKMGDSNEK